jgi:hypothetical protein
MSLRLDVFEKLLDTYKRSDDFIHSVPFCYSKTYLELRDISQKTHNRISSGSYNAKSLEQAKSLIAAWNEIEQSNPSPPIYRWRYDQPSVAELRDILSWTLERCGFSMVTDYSAGDLVHRIFVLNGTETHLRVVTVSKRHVVAYLDSYRLLCDIARTSAVQVPLVFQLSCILPLIGATPQPKLESMPQETLTRVLTFMTIDEMGLLVGASRQIQSCFDSDFLWQEIWNSYEKYIKGQKPIGLELHPGEHKAVISNLISERQKRREARFVQSIALSDWSGPVHFIDRSSLVVDPVREIRRRRMDMLPDPLGELRTRTLDVMDDLDLDIH